jgi:hypothetical protein
MVAATNSQVACGMATTAALMMTAGNIRRQQLR